MARFHCPKCGHSQQASESKLGLSVACPKCGQPGNVSTEEPAVVAAHTNRSATRLQSATPALLLAGVLLLGCSVVLQTLQLLESMRERAAKGPMEVVVSEPIELDTGYNGLSVSVESFSPSITVPVDVERSVTLPIEIQAVSTSDELPVNLRNHYIIGSDPIPVEFAN